MRHYLFHGACVRAFWRVQEEYCMRFTVKYLYDFFVVATLLSRIDAYVSVFVCRK